MSDQLDDWYAEAQDAFEDGDEAECERLVAAMIEANPDDPRTLEARGDFARLHENFQQAEDLYRRIGRDATDPEANGTAMFSLASLRVEQKEFQDARSFFASAVNLFAEADSCERTIDALVNLARTHEYLGELEQCAASLHRALRVIDADVDPERFDLETAHILLELGGCYRLLGELDAADETLSDALERFRKLEDAGECAACLDALGVVQQIRGNYDGAEELHEQAVVINEAIDSMDGLSVNFGNLTMLSIHRRDLDAAAEYAQRAHEIDAELGNENGIAHFHLLMGDIECQRGNLVSAEESLLKARDLYEVHGDVEDSMSVLSQLGVVYRHSGRLDESEKMCETALSLAEESGHADGIACVLDEFAEVRKLQGRTDEARELWTRSLKLFEELESSRMIREVNDNLRKL